jgi:hypothetical protein
MNSVIFKRRKIKNNYVKRNTFNNLFIQRVSILALGREDRDYRYKRAVLKRNKGIVKEKREKKPHPPKKKKKRYLSELNIKSNSPVNLKNLSL